MLKGVRKKVVEVVDMENEYFERAILFVKPEQEDKDLAMLRRKGREYVNAIAYRPRMGHRSKPFWRNTLQLVLAAAVGAALMFLLLL